MTKRDLIAAADAVRELVQRLDLGALVSKVLEGSRTDAATATGQQRGAITELISALVSLASGLASSGEAERRVARAIGIDMYCDPSVIAQLVVKPSAQHMIRISDAVRLLTQLDALLDLISTDAMKSSTPGAGASTTGEAILVVTVLEAEGTSSRPARIVEAIDSIEALYVAHATMERENPDTLRIVGCDSGSDKSFDFLGLAQTMDALRTTILELWDRIVFYRERKVGAEVEIIAQSLPILERLSKMQADGTLGPEAAEIVRKKLLAGCTGFVESGISIAEIDARAHVEPRLLLAPSQKLLAPGPIEVDGTTDGKEGSPGNNPLAGLTPEQIQQIHKIVKGE